MFIFTNYLHVNRGEFHSILREHYINISLDLEAVSARKRCYVSAVTPTLERLKQRTKVQCICHLTYFSFRQLRTP